MFLRLAALGASQIASLVLGQPGTMVESQIKDFLAQPATLDVVADGFDADHGGVVTADEIFRLASADNNTTPPSAQPLLSGFLASLKSELAVGAGKEQISALGVQRSDLPQAYCSQAGKTDGRPLIFPDPEQPYIPRRKFFPPRIMRIDGEHLEPQTRAERKRPQPRCPS